MLVAGAANLLIAVAKLVAGLASGSSAMLSEAAHSVGDTMNQVFLMASLRKSRKPPDEEHPFGYGMERYFWSLLAAVSIFVLGAGFSAYQGIQALTARASGDRRPGRSWCSAASFVFEGTSFLKAVRAAPRRRLRAGAPTCATTCATTPTRRCAPWCGRTASLWSACSWPRPGLAADTVTGGRTCDGVASLAIAAAARRRSPTGSAARTSST